jgi:hypothetical protein
MATIYDKNGEHLTQGLQGSAVCDEAIQCARRLAARGGETVCVDDDGEYYAVEADGEKHTRGTEWMCAALARAGVSA